MYPAFKIVAICQRVDQRTQGFAVVLQGMGLQHQMVMLWSALGEALEHGSKEGFLAGKRAVVSEICIMGQLEKYQVVRISAKT